MDDSPPRPKPTSFQRLVRWTCRLAWLALMGVLGFVLTGVLAGWMLARPPRRALQDYHRDYLDHPAAHGLLIHRAEVSIDGPPHPVPYLVCEPDVHAGPAARGTKLRDQLAAGGSVVPAYGFVRGNLVLLHGRKGRKEDLLPVAERFCAAGFRCLLPDLPAHGENMAPNCGYGTFVQEAEIPAAVLDDAARRFSFSADQPAGLWGISMGGSYALSAAKVDAKRWDRVIVVCSFARLYDVVQGQARHLAGPLGPRLARIAAVSSRLLGGADPRLVQPVRVAAHVSARTLVVHGTGDPYVPLGQGLLLFNALPDGAGRKAWIEVPGGDHHNVLVTEMPLYAAMADWFANGK